MMLDLLMTRIRRATVGTEFSGPGVDGGRMNTVPDGSVLVAVTHGRLGRGPRRAFDLHTRHVFASLDAQPGYVGGAIRREILGKQVWTMTAWDDEASLNGFVRSTHHRDAIREAGRLFVHTKFVRVEVPRGDLPLTWERALAWLSVR